MGARLLASEDPEVSEHVAQALRADGVQVYTAFKALRCELHGDEKRLIAEHQGNEHTFIFDDLLVAVGRQARLSGYGLEARSEEHTSELQSRGHLVCRLLLEKKKK